MALIRFLSRPDISIIRTPPLVLHFETMNRVTRTELYKQKNSSAKLYTNHSFRFCDDRSN